MRRYFSLAPLTVHFLLPCRGFDTFCGTKAVILSTFGWSVLYLCSISLTTFQRLTYRALMTLGRFLTVTFRWFCKHKRIICIPLHPPRQSLNCTLCPLRSISTIEHSQHYFNKSARSSLKQSIPRWCYHLIASWPLQRILKVRFYAISYRNYIIHNKTEIWYISRFSFAFCFLPWMSFINMWHLLDRLLLRELGRGDLSF